MIAPPPPLRPHDITASVERYPRRWPRYRVEILVRALPIDSFTAFTAGGARRAAWRSLRRHRRVLASPRRDLEAVGAGSGWPPEDEVPR